MTWPFPAPKDDGAARHLVRGFAMPDIALPTTGAREVNFSRLDGWTILFVYPWTGRPGGENPPNWDDIPGAHGNQASGVSSAEAATGAASNVATLTVTAAAPTIAKAFLPATIAADGTSTITFTLANANGVPLTAAAIFT